MNSIPLMQIVLDTVLFFELCDDNVVHPDEAVRQLEAISTELKRLSISDRQEFIRYVSAAADAEEAGHSDNSRIDSMRSLATRLGLSEP